MTNPGSKRFWSKLNLEWLRAFVAFSECVSISEAAKSLGLSQPAVTLQLQRLEAAVGQPLFEMRGKRKTLTAFGRELLTQVSPVLRNLEVQIEQALASSGNLSRLQLRLGVRAELSLRAIDFLKYEGGLQVCPMGNTEAWEMLTQGRVDLICVHERRPEIESTLSLTAVPFFRDKTVLAAHRSVRFPEGFSNKKAWAEFLKTERVFLYGDEAPLLRPLLQFASVRRSELSPRLVCEDWRVIREQMVQHRGFAVVPENTASEAKGRLLVVELPDRMSEQGEHWIVLPQYLKALFPEITV